MAPPKRLVVVAFYRYVRNPMYLGFFVGWVGLGCGWMATRPARVLAGPKPAKGARGQQAVNESIDDFLDGRAPRLTLPDAVAQVPQAVAEERRGAGDPKNGWIRRAGPNRVSGEIGDEEADD